MLEGTSWLGLGGAGIGNLYRAVDDAAAAETIRHALTAGLRVIDTAPYYGHGLSEARIGAALRAWKGEPPRISTKVGRVLDVALSGDVGDFGFVNPLPFRPRFDYSRDGIRRSLSESLSRLGLAKIDTILIHDIGRLTHGDDHARILRQVLDEALPELRAARAEGLLDRIGIGVNEWQVCAEFLDHADIDVILLAGRYTLLEQSALGLMDLCVRRNVRVLAGGVFNSGLLATRPGTGSTYDYKIAPPDVVQRANALWNTCERFDIPLQAAALRFVAAHPAVETVLVGARSAAEVEDLLRWSAVELPPELWQSLKREGYLAPDAPLPMY
jgi:D-threo-aldose 1-dehydrogenase